MALLFRQPRQHCALLKRVQTWLGQGLDQLLPPLTPPLPGLRGEEQAALGATPAAGGASDHLPVEFLPDDPDEYCHRCGASIGPGLNPEARCPHCVSQSVSWRSIVRLSVYKPPMQNWIAAMKFSRQWTWATYFGAVLAQQIPPAQNPDKTAVCFVPMHWRRRLQRGFNQAQLMAESLAQQRHWPVAPVLRRCQFTAPQTRVAPARRRINVANSFAILPVELRGWDVWLIDDVKTTGATLAACTRLLRQSGARVHVAVAAVADPHHGDFQNV